MYTTHNVSTYLIVRDDPVDNFLQKAVIRVVVPVGMLSRNGRGKSTSRELILPAILGNDLEVFLLMLLCQVLSQGCITGVG